MKQIVLFFTTIFIVTTAWAQPLVKYVTQNGAGLKNGSSWANAWNDSIFAANLHLQPAGTEVWVARGTYKPGYGLSGQESYSFYIPSGVKLYGGFAGSETVLNDRVPALIHGTNQTKLTGILNQTGMISNYVVQMNNCIEGERIDGFTVVNATRNGIRLAVSVNGITPPVINNCTISGSNSPTDSVGGMSIYGLGNSPVEISNCLFQGNQGSLSGAIYSSNAKPNFVNCVFSKSFSFFLIPPASSVVYFKGGSGQFANCTFVRNHTNQLTGLMAMENVVDSILITNSIFWANADFGTASQVLLPFKIISGNNQASIKNCLLQAETSIIYPTTSINNISTFPFFQNQDSIFGTDGQWGTADDGLRLTTCSPAVNAGNNVFANGITQDILGNSRSFGGQVDLGAYELQQPATTGITVQQQPVSIMVTPADTARFSVTATGGTLGYQWQQYNLSNGWINLLNDTVYSGVTSAQLTISKLYISLSGQGQQFRCLINNQYCNGYVSNAAKLFVRQPIVNNLCPNSNATLYAGIISYPPENKIFQWQVDTGINGYRNIFNGTHYSGTNTNSLQLINAPSAWYGYKYRCHELNYDEYGNLYVLKFTNTWRGTVNNSWENPANWSCGMLPDANTDVTIGTTTTGGVTTPSNVIVGANSICRSLTILPGGNTVTVLSGFTLTVVR